MQSIFPFASKWPAHLIARWNTLTIYNSLGIQVASLATCSCWTRHGWALVIQPLLQAVELFGIVSDAALCTVEWNGTIWRHNKKCVHTVRLDWYCQSMAANYGNTSSGWTVVYAESITTCVGSLQISLSASTVWVLNGVKDKCSLREQTREKKRQQESNRNKNAGWTRNLDMEENKILAACKKGLAATHCVQPKFYIYYSGLFLFLFIYVLPFQCLSKDS